MFIESNVELGMFIVRVVVGSVFLFHGADKFGLFGGAGLPGYIGWLAGIGIPTWLGYASAFLEFFSGLFLVLGFATELAALGGIIMMISAYKLVHHGHGYFMHLDPLGCEYVLNLSLLCLAIILSGPTFWYLWNPFIRG